MKAVLAFFGAFNPPTIAHLKLAEEAMRAAGREGVVFVPSKSAYIRGEQGKDFAFTDEERLAMLRTLSEHYPFVEVYDGEIRRKEQPRTYLTLCALRDMGYQPSLLFGSDKLAELETGWKYTREIAEEFGMVCMTRGEDDCERMLRENPFLRALAPHILLVKTPESYRHVSSTQVRRAVREGRAEDLRASLPAELLPFFLDRDGQVRRAAGI